MPVHLCSSIVDTLIGEQTNCVLNFTEAKSCARSKNSTVLPFCSDRPFAHGDGQLRYVFGGDRRIGENLRALVGCLQWNSTSERWWPGRGTHPNQPAVEVGRSYAGRHGSTAFGVFEATVNSRIGRKYGIATKNNPEDVQRFCRQRGLLYPYPYLAYGTSDLLKAARELTLLAMDTSRISHNDLTAWHDLYKSAWCMVCLCFLELEENLASSHLFPDW